MRMDIDQGSRGGVFFWNVDAAVGLNAVNNFDDVLFVQWCLYKMAEWPARPEKLRAGLRGVLVNGECSGREGDPLITRIRLLQAEQGLAPDGRVSPARGGTYNKRGTKHTFLVHYLNAVLRNLYPNQYPRLDQMPQFIWRIREKVTQPFI